MIALSARRLRLAALAAAAGLLCGCQAVKLVGLYFTEKQYTDDRILVAKLQGELAAHPELEGAAIEVDAYLDDVLLTGTASSAQSLRAEQIVRAMDGVAAVDNRVRIRDE